MSHVASGRNRWRRKTQPRSTGFSAIGRNHQRLPPAVANERTEHGSGGDVSTCVLGEDRAKELRIDEALIRAQEEEPLVPRAGGTDRLRVHPPLPTWRRRIHPQKLHAWISLGGLGRGGERPIRGPVVHDEEFEVRVVLLEDRVDERADARRLVVRRDDDRE